MVLPHSCDNKARDRQNYYSGCRRVYGVWWFPTIVRIRLPQPPAGDWLAGAELGKNESTDKVIFTDQHYQCQKFVSINKS